jgi:hypothetical protein
LRIHWLPRRVAEENVFKMRFLAKQLRKPCLRKAVVQVAGVRNPAKLGCNRFYPFRVARTEAVNSNSAA